MSCKQTAQNSFSVNNYICPMIWGPAQSIVVTEYGSTDQKYQTNQTNMCDGEVTIVYSFLSLIICICDIMYRRGYLGINEYMPWLSVKCDYFPCLRYLPLLPICIFWRTQAFVICNCTLLCQINCIYSVHYVLSWISNAHRTAQHITQL